MRASHIYCTSQFWRTRPLLDQGSVFDLRHSMVVHSCSAFSQMANQNENSKQQIERPLFGRNGRTVRSQEMRAVVRCVVFLCSLASVLQPSSSFQSLSLASFSHPPLRHRTVLDPQSQSMSAGAALSSRLTMQLPTGKTSSKHSSLRGGMGLGRTRTRPTTTARRLGETSPVNKQHNPQS